MLEKTTRKLLKVVSLSTDVPDCFSIKVLAFQKKAPDSPKYVLVWPPRKPLVCPHLGLKNRPKMWTNEWLSGGQTNTFQFASSCCKNEILTNGGQTNNSQKGQKVDKQITLRHIYIYTYIHIYIHIYI